MSVWTLTANHISPLSRAHMMPTSTVAIITIAHNCRVICPYVSDSIDVVHMWLNSILIKILLRKLELMNI